MRDSRDRLRARSSVERNDQLGECSSACVGAQLEPMPWPVEVVEPRTGIAEPDSVRLSLRGTQIRIMSTSRLASTYTRPTPSVESMP